MAPVRPGGGTLRSGGALPTAIAYAGIVGFEPVVGLYAAILPLMVYCLLGTSRHLIVNPDAATCELIAGTLAPWPGKNRICCFRCRLYWRSSRAWSALRLACCGWDSWLTSFPPDPGRLSQRHRDSIFLGQLGKVFGFPMEAHGILPSLLELLGKPHQRTSRR